MKSGNTWVGSVAAALAIALASAVAVATAGATATVSVSNDGGSSATGAASTPEMVKEFNAWVNGFLFSAGVFEWAEGVMGAKAAHYFLTYVRNFLAGSILYYVTASIWHW